MDSKNSELFLVLRSLSSRKSIASMVPIGLRIRRSTYIFFSTCGSVMSSSLRVPEREMSIAGKVRLSETLRYRMSSELPVPLNSSKMTSSMRLPVSTSAVDTGSRMDEVIFEEFKGTGNSELILYRKVSDKRTFPAIDISRSGTRKEELITDPQVLKKMYVLRRILNPMGTMDGIDFLLDKLRSTKSNAEFFESMNT